MSKPVAYVSNLPYEVVASILEEAFDEEGFAVENVELLKKGNFGRMKTCGLAAVTLAATVDISDVVSKMDGKLLLGRPMIIRSDKFAADDLNYKPAGAK